MNNGCFGIFRFNAIREFIRLKVTERYIHLIVNVNGIEGGIHMLKEQFPQVFVMDGIVYQKAECDLHVLVSYDVFKQIPRAYEENSTP
jgi:hypothetical protein